jgi:hypothetical protein
MPLSDFAFLRESGMEIVVADRSCGEYFPLMERAESGKTEAITCVRTLRLKVKSEAYPWLRAAATEVNQVWNFDNATSDKAARPFSRSPSVVVRV